MQWNAVEYMQWSAVKCSFIQFSAVQCSAVDNKLEVLLVDYADTELEYSNNDYGMGYLFLFVSSSKKKTKVELDHGTSWKPIYFLLWIIVKQNMTGKYMQENFSSFQNYKQGRSIQFYNLQNILPSKLCTRVQLFWARNYHNAAIWGTKTYKCSANSVFKIQLKKKKRFWN